MLSIAICDDDPAAIKEMQRLLSKMNPSDEYIVREYNSRQALETAVEQGLRVDIAYIDIKLDDDNGVELAKDLFPEGSRTQVIFCSGYIELCSSVYETDHVYFLIKPFDEPTFRRAFFRALKRLELKSERSLQVQIRSGIYRVPYSEIEYLESRGRKVTVHWCDKKLEFYSTLADIMMQAPDNFVQCHKSFCVNMDYIRQLEPTKIVLKSGQVVSISQSKRAETRLRFLNYMNGMD